ncbi:phage portal protein [Lactococcus insecticola]|uniref:Phage portal protein n=1 Tax=Pseudolactococcus insecticola TaxID=2709158 RepID=A0A6A0B5P5_9LACT|nr:phage portal protein [Lactococcus insecticola]GFH39838.1 hypothetical protein Hs20B_02360 [Lactococcus insecticola]
MADIEFTEESMGRAPASSPIANDTQTGEIAVAEAGEGRRVPFMDSKAEMQRQIQHDITQRKKNKIQNGYKPHNFIVTDDLADFMKHRQELTSHKSFGIEKGGAYVPFDEIAVDFFSSNIKWSNPSNLTYKILSRTLAMGYCLVYANADVTVETSFEPIFDTAGNVIAVINDKNEVLANGIRYVYQANKGYIGTPETFSIDWYQLVKLDDMKPIYADAINLINAYTDSLNDNSDSLRAFAESILTITGIDSTQGITPEQLQAIGEEAINVLAFEAQMGGDGTFGATPKADFIAPPLNTEAREKWSSRVRNEIYTTLSLPDFEQIAGNVSTDTIRIYLYRTIQRAKNIADSVIEVFKVILNDANLTYEIDTPSSPNDNMKALDGITYLSDETKLRLAFPEWSDKQVSDELGRLQATKMTSGDAASMVSNLIGGVNDGNGRDD